MVIDEWKWNQKLQISDPDSPLSQGGVSEKKQRIGIQEKDVDWFKSLKGQEEFARQASQSGLLAYPEESVENESEIGQKVSGFLKPFQKDKNLAAQELALEFTNAVRLAESKGKSGIKISLVKFIFKRDEVTGFLANYNNSFVERNLLLNTTMAIFLGFNASQAWTLKLDLGQAKEILNSSNLKATLLEKYITPAFDKTAEIGKNASLWIGAHAAVNLRLLKALGFISFDLLHEQRYLRVGRQMTFGSGPKAQMVEATFDTQVRNFVKDGNGDLKQIKSPVDVQNMVVEYKWPAAFADKGFLSRLPDSEQKMIAEVFAQVVSYQKQDPGNVGKKGKFFAHLSQIFESQGLGDFILTKEADEHLKNPAQARAEIERS